MFDGFRAQDAGPLASCTVREAVGYKLESSCRVIYELCQPGTCIGLASPNPGVCAHSVYIEREP